MSVYLLQYMYLKNDRKILIRYVLPVEPSATQHLATEQFRTVADDVGLLIKWWEKRTHPSLSQF
jgi:hypothetical protein